MNRAPRKPSGGQSLVEFALILLPLLVILFGVFDFGRAIYAYNTLANAARAGVRVAIVNQNAAGSGCVGAVGGAQPDATKISAKDCAESAAVALGPVTAAVTYQETDSNGVTTGTACAPIHVGCVAVVTTTYTFSPVTPIISGLVGAGIPLSSTSQEPVEFVCPVAAVKCDPGQ